MIIIMGSVGSGKTEQGERLAKKLDCPTISTSQLLRDNPTKRRLEYMQAGKLVADSDVLELLEPALKMVGADKKEVILDGAPRSIPQARWMVSKIKNREVMLTGIIKLNVSDKVVLQRLLNRGRKDDKKSVVLKRLQQYHSITSPVVSYLKQNGIPVTVVNGENQPDEVERDVDRALGIV